MSSNPITNAPGAFRKKLYLHDPTPEELAADAIEEEKQRKAEQKAAKKSALPFVPASVAAASKKPAPPAFAPASIKRREASTNTYAARNGADPVSHAAADADLASLIDPDAQPSKRARIESDFGAQLQAQMQAEREYGVSYAYDNRPKPQRAGKGRNKKHKDLEPTGSSVAYDVTQYTAPDITELEEAAAEWRDYLRKWSRKKARKPDTTMRLPISPARSEDEAYSPPRPAFSKPLNFAPPAAFDDHPPSTAPRRPPEDHFVPAPVPTFVPVAPSHVPPPPPPPSLPQSLAPPGPPPDVVMPPAASTPSLDRTQPNVDEKTVEERKAHAADLVAQIKARLAAKSASGSTAGTSANAGSTPIAGSSPVPAPPVAQPLQLSENPPAPVQAMQTNRGVYSAPFQPMVQSVPPPPPPPEPEADAAAPAGFAGRATADKFAEKMLQKYGWEKGKGLGANNDGITTAIFAKAEKRKKLADADGGGFATPKNMGKIVGGKKRKVAQDGGDAEEPDAAKLSEVIKLEGMLDGLDLDHEISENNLLQEIGDEMASSGQVERLFIWREEQGGKNEVFVKYTSPLSALRALKSCDGMEFADNKVVARFWDVEKFERGEYE